MVTVRTADASDSDALWEWRNDPTTRANSLHQDEIGWPEHQAWFAAALRSDARRIYVGLDSDGKRIGMVRFDYGADHVEVSINLAPEARGRRLSVPLLLAAIAALSASTAPLELRAEIRPDNAPSLRLFERAGFAPRSQDRGIWTYVRGSD